MSPLFFRTRPVELPNGVNTDFGESRAGDRAHSPHQLDGKVVQEPARLLFTVHSEFFLSNNLRLMTDAPVKTPLRMTAKEFVTAIAVMAGAAKVNKRPPKPKLVVLEDRRSRVTPSSKPSRLKASSSGTRSRRAQWSLAPMDRRRSRPLAASRCRSTM